MPQTGRLAAFIRDPQITKEAEFVGDVRLNKAANVSMTLTAGGRPIETREREVVPPAEDEETTGNESVPSGSESAGGEATSTDAVASSESSSGSHSSSGSE